METMTAFDWLWELNVAVGCFPSSERPNQKEKVSNGELRRWIKNGAVIINGERVSPDTAIPELNTLVLFPASRRKKTSFRFA